jgi:glutathione S-transferase
MDSHLNNRRYFVGKTMSLADIALVAYTRWAGEGGFDLNGWPNVRDWVSHIEKELGLVDHLDTPS